MSTKLKKAGLFAAVLGATFTIGIAFAAWTANGSGTGYAKAKAKAALTTGTATPTADLYPGSTGGVSINAVNANPYPVLITSVAPNGPTSPDCGVTFSGASGLSQYVPANGSATFTLPDAVTMSVDSPDSCAGQTITIPITFTGTSTTPTTAAPPTTTPPSSTTPIVDTHPTWTLASGQTAQFYSGQGLGQTFTRTTSGSVSAAEVFVTNPGGVAGGTAQVKVWTVLDNGTLGTVLSTQTVSNLNPVFDQWLRFTLPTSVSVPQKFAITILPNWSSTSSYVARGTSNPYPGGAIAAGTTTWSSNPSSSEDLRIRVYGV